MENIKIMGAGVSGLSAAINLAKAGYTVNVFEKRSDCGKRFLGDLEGFENWSSTVDILDEIRSMNIKINFGYHPFETIHISNGNEVVKNTFDKPMFYIVKRGPVENSLDIGLKNQALDAGVNIHFNSNPKKEDMDIISIGPAEYKPFAVAKGIRFETESDDIAVALINSKASKNAYSYLLITKGYGCICTVNLYIPGLNANVYFKKTYDFIIKLFNPDIKNPQKIGGFGSFRFKSKLTEKGKIYTGEAAGLQDLLWGFGMRYAINSGYFAALSITENKNYKKLVKRQLSGRLKRSVVNRYLVEKWGDYFYNYFFKQAKQNKNWDDLLYIGYNPSSYSRVMYPFAKRSLARKLATKHSGESIY